MFRSPNLLAGCASLIYLKWILTLSLIKIGKGLRELGASLVDYEFRFRNFALK